MGPYVVFASQEEKERALRGIEITTKDDAVAEWILPVRVLAK
jgi:hypothetical protein